MSHSDHSAVIQSWLLVCISTSSGILFAGVRHLGEPSTTVQWPSDAHSGLLHCRVLPNTCSRAYHQDVHLLRQGGLQWDILGIDECLFKYGDSINFHTTTSLICLLTKITIVQLDWKRPKLKRYSAVKWYLQTIFVLIVLDILSVGSVVMPVGECFYDWFGESIIQLICLKH